MRQIGNEIKRDSINSNRDGFFNTDIVKRIISGDSRAFEILFKTYYQSLIKFCYIFVEELSVAENIVQEVFLKLWSRKEKLHPEMAIKSYLYRAVKNRAIDHRRHLKVRRSTAGEIYRLSFKVPTPEEKLGLTEQQEIVARFIERLPVRCKTVFLMSKFQNLKYSEIAEILNISIKTVENHMLKAMRFLTEHIRKLMILFLFVFLR